MDPQSYQAMMVQQLMGGATQAPGMGGQNPATPYGQSFMTGNQMMPQQQGGPGGGMSNFGMLNQSAPNNVMQQPMQSYTL